MKRPTFAVLVVAGAMAVGAGVPTSVASSPRPALRIVPHTVAIGGPATIVGSHLPSQRYFSMLLAVPNGSKSPVRAFVSQLALTDARGNLNVHFHMPLVTRCGPATIYLYASTRSVMLKVPFILKGCKASGQVSPPPPPPVRKTPTKP